MRKIRGGEIGIIFQDPLSALNPVMTVNEQIGEILALHQDEELRELAADRNIPTYRSKKWSLSPGFEFTIMAVCFAFLALFTMLGQFAFGLPFLVMIGFFFLRDYLQRDLPDSALDLMVLDALSRVKMPDPSQVACSYPHELSGGMQQRVMIAMALAGRARMLIADEPTTALDVTIQAQILQLIKDIQKETGMSVLLITHDLGVVAETCERVAVMYAGRIVEQGPADEIFTNPRHEYTKSLLASIPKGGEERLKAPPYRGIWCDMSTETVIEVEGLSKHFPIRNVIGTVTGLVKAVDGIDIRIEAGKTLGIVGESGCGKTTLMRTLLRLVDATAGSVILSDQLGGDFASNRLEELSHAELRSFRRQVGIVFQDPMGALNPRMLIKDIVSEPLIIHGRTGNIRKRVTELLETVGLGGEHLYRYPHEFSGGQRQRIVIARALALEPKILILDEPTSALDVSVQARILNLLNDLQEKFELTYIFISHDLSVIEHMCDRVAVMYLGKIVEEAEAETLFSNPRHPYTQALVSAIPSFDPTMRKKRIVLEGDVPSPAAPPSGCHFHPRCPIAVASCATEYPELRKHEDCSVACHLV